MFTDVQIINLGLSKITSSRINRIDPAVTPLEKYMAANYQHWKRSELTRRRWVFATEDDYALTKVATLENVSQPYKYALPINCLRPVREKRTEWKQRGRFLYSAYDSLKISYIRNASEDEFDPLFEEVLACAIGKNANEYVNQSNTKYANAKAAYDEAVNDAAKANAFVIGPENINSDDDFEGSWLTARHNG